MDFGVKFGIQNPFVSIRFKTGNCSRLVVVGVNVKVTNKWKLWDATNIVVTRRSKAREMFQTYALLELQKVFIFLMFFPFVIDYLQCWDVLFRL